MPFDSIPERGLFYFGPPYQSYRPVSLGWTLHEPPPGTCIAWFMAGAGEIFQEFQWVRARPSWLPLFVVLPQPQDILSIAPHIKTIPELRPRAVIPTSNCALAPALRTLLAAPPRSLPIAAVDHLRQIQKIPDAQTKDVIQAIFAAAPHVSSVEKLSRRMCKSRRTLGRFFQERELPVPSHWLQFARILHVAIQIQNTSLNVHRVSARYGYTDGFTMSNSMKRLTGYRPSFVREHLGWEWIVNAWVNEEDN